MTIEAYQSVLARMLVDAPFRRRVRHAPAAACAGMDLSAEERAALRGLDPARIDAEARAVEDGRAQLFRSALTPELEAAASPEVLKALARAYAVRFTERGMRPWRESVLLYLRWLEGAEAARVGASATFAALVRFLRLRLVLPQPVTAAEITPTAETRVWLASHAAWVAFPVDLLEALKQVRSEGPRPVCLPPAPTWYLIRQTANGVTVDPVEGLFRAVLDRADGSRSIGRLADEVMSLFPGTRAAQLAPLLEARVLEGTLRLGDVRRGAPGTPTPTPL